ncbi:hypothetical protein GY45DRAFT_386055 [Cubamyces sp. BRFM 1775]|nr:hypothetical protein GY45DRAFT_386055 [Cubamyces sp. BRFM 1775]
MATTGPFDRLRNRTSFCHTVWCRSCRMPTIDQRRESLQPRDALGSVGVFSRTFNRKFAGREQQCSAADERASTAQHPCPRTYATHQSIMHSCRACPPIIVWPGSTVSALRKLTSRYLGYGRLRHRNLRRARRSTYEGFWTTRTHGCHGRRVNHCTRGPPPVCRALALTPGRYFFADRAIRRSRSSASHQLGETRRCNSD